MQIVWDLNTDNRLPVGSGVYIYRIDVEGVGSKTDRLAVFIEKSGWTTSNGGTDRDGARTRCFQARRIRNMRGLLMRIAIPMVLLGVAGMRSREARPARDVRGAGAAHPGGAASIASAGPPWRSGTARQRLLQPASLAAVDNAEASSPTAPTWRTRR